MSDISTLSASMNGGAFFQAQATPVSASYSALGQQGTPASAMSFSVGTNTALAINEVYSTVLSIAAGGTENLDLTSLTNVLGTSFSFARVKAILIQLLSASQDPTNGTACSSVTVGAAGSDPFAWFLGGTSPTITLNNGEYVQWATPSAAGITVDGTHKVLKIVNNDSSNPAAVQITVFGSDA